MYSCRCNSHQSGQSHQLGAWDVGNIVTLCNDRPILGLQHSHMPASVQVYYTMQKMDEYGCDLFLDIHGDEEIPFNFLAGSEGIPSFNERLRDLQNTFSTAFVRASPDFQPKNGYTVDEPGKANLAISSNGVSTPGWAWLGCAVLCCAVLCCAVLRCAAPGCAVPCCAAMCCAVLKMRCLAKRDLIKQHDCNAPISLRYTAARKHGVVRLQCGGKTVCGCKGRNYNLCSDVYSALPMQQHSRVMCCMEMCAILHVV